MEYLHKYIEQGIKVFACNSDKTPATTRGFYDATTSIDILKAQFHTPEKMLIGMPTGNGNNIVVIDIDVNKPMEDEHGAKILDDEGNEIIDPRTVDELLDELKTYGEIPDTYQIETPSGGRHFYFQVPFTRINSARRFFNKTLPIDVKSSGGYVIVPDGKSDYTVYDDVDGKEVDDIRSRCAVLPQWIEDFKKAVVESESEETGNILPIEEVREIRSALGFLSSDDRDTWIRIGMALKSTGSPTAKGLWNEWSQNSLKYNALDQEKRWKTLKPSDITIATVFHEAKKLGWHTTYEKKGIEDIKDVTFKLEKHSRPPFPKDLLHPPGLVGDFIEYINGKSIKDQPILALGASLAAVGALLGRKIQTETNIRTNIYCLGVGASGSGKEAARKAIKDLFHCAGCGHMACVEEIASDSSIATHINKTPSQIFLLDEIGRFLKTTTQASKSPHLYNIVTSLLKLYSSSNSVFHGKIYADDSKQVHVENPNLCIYGTTVPESLYKGLTIENITDGFLSRMLIFESESPDPPKKPRRNLTKRPPVELLEKITKTYNKKTIHIPEGNIDNQVNVYPQTVDISDDAVSILEDFDTYVREMRDKMRLENRVDTIYNRTSQIAEQIALIIAGGIDIDYPKITDREMIYAINLTKYLADCMLYITENFIADNDYHHAVKNMLQLIRKSGRITMSQITRKTQDLQARVRNDILETLKESEQVKEFSEGTGHSKKRIFIPI
jgi:predicted RNA-binding protein Jag